LTLHKYQRLVHGSKDTLLKQKMLEKDIRSEIKLTGSKSHRWMSPYRDGGNRNLQYAGKPIVPKKIEVTNAANGNSDPSQLKVLNLDRMFRKKGGTLTNVVPLPVTKLQSVTSRPNVLRVVRKKDKIHDVIEEYNRLIRIMTLSKTKSRLGVRGKNFTVALTLEELMGIKPKTTRNVFMSENDEISD
jgi:hypothetical protein